MYTVEVTLKVYDSKTGTCHSCLTINSFDTRTSLADLVSMNLPLSNDPLLLFLRDPFTNKSAVDVFDPAATVHATLNKEHPPFEFHFVFIPCPDQITYCQTDRWNVPRPVVVRLFNSHVVELNYEIIYFFPNDTIADLVARSRTAFSLDANLRYRVLDIDTQDCEILAVYGEDDRVTPLSSLLVWGASNIFANSVRIEPDDDEKNTVFCSHRDRRARVGFGDPFILDLPFPENQEELRNEIARKLNLSTETVETLRLFVEDEDRLIIEHHFNHEGAREKTRERPLVIKG
jgi:hypothetical protein